MQQKLILFKRDAILFSLIETTTLLLIAQDFRNSYIEKYYNSTLTSQD